jgi:hypothetical protein
VNPSVDSRTVTVAPLTVTRIVVGLGGADGVVAVVGAAGALAADEVLLLVLEEPQADTPRAAAPPPARAATAINCARMVKASQLPGRTQNATTAYCSAAARMTSAWKISW